MILLIDIGNTRLKWAVLCDGQLGQQHAALYDPAGVPALLTQAWSQLPTPDAVYLVSVAASGVTQAVVDWVTRQWACPLQLLHSAKQGAGVNNGYTQPERLGVDRWMAMIGAYHIVGSAVCVIDCGTALTCDVIDSGGNHLGGVIAPGQEMMRRSLLDSTAGIAFDANALPVSGWGTDTASCVLAGGIHSAVGLIERVITQVQAQLKQPVAVVLTGGDAESILPLIANPYRYEADLVLQGIACVIKEQRG